MLHAQYVELCTWTCAPRTPIFILLVYIVPQPGLLASSSEESDGYVYETSGLIVCRGSVTPPRAGGGMVPPSALHGDLNVPSLHDP